MTTRESAAQGAIAEGATLQLVRHGKHDWLFPPINRLAGRLPGVHLNAEGRREVEALARRLVAAPPDRIVSSPLDRTMETAAIIAQACGRDVIVDERLVETGLGPWEGLAVADVMARDPQGWQAWQVSPATCAVEGLERIDVVAARMSAAAAGYLAAGGSTLCASHRDPLAALICTLLDLPPDAMRRLEISPASLTVFQESHGRLVLITLNSTGAAPTHGEPDREVVRQETT